jgi:hypothetical protein
MQYVLEIVAAEMIPTPKLASVTVLKRQVRAVLYDRETFLGNVHCVQLDPENAPFELGIGGADDPPKGGCLARLSKAPSKADRDVTGSGGGAAAAAHDFGFMSWRIGAAKKAKRAAAAAGSLFGCDGCVVRCDSASKHIRLLFELSMTICPADDDERAEVVHVSCGWAELALCTGDAADAAGTDLFIEPEEYEVPVFGGSLCEKARFVSNLLFYNRNLALFLYFEFGWLVFDASRCRCPCHCCCYCRCHCRYRCFNCCCWSSCVDAFWCWFGDLTGCCYEWCDVATPPQVPVDGTHKAPQSKKSKKKRPDAGPTLTVRLGR